MGYEELVFTGYEGRRDRDVTRLYSKFTTEAVTSKASTASELFLLLLTCLLLNVVINFCINTLMWIGVNLCVRVYVTDVTSIPQRVLWERGYKVYYNTYSGNESPTYCSGRHGHLYRATATVKEGYEGGTDDTRASEDCTIKLPGYG